MLVSLPKKFPSSQGQLISFGPKLSNLMFHGSLSKNYFEILWHIGAQHIDKSNVSQFPQTNRFGATWAKFGPKLHKLY